MNDSNGQMRHVHAVTTLRSEKIIEKYIYKKPPQVKEVSKDTTSEAKSERITAEDEHKERASV